MTNHDKEDAKHFEWNGTAVKPSYKNNHGHKLTKPTVFEDEHGHCHTAIPISGKVQDLVDLHGLLSKHHDEFCLTMGAKVILNQIDNAIGQLTREALLLADNEEG